MKALVLFPLLAVLAACGTNPPPSIVQQPMSVRPAPEAAPQAAEDGSIFNGSRNARRMALFQDRRSTRVGDIVTIVINEQISASSKANTSASRDGSLTADGSIGANGIPYFPDALERIMGVNASTGTTLEHKGEGATSSSNAFSGTITVTVIEALPNGNLVVSGEKQLAINAETEYLRFSGVINPDDIGAGNTVSSLKVADARLEHRGAGNIARAQEPGWLARFFQSIAPF